MTPFFCSFRYSVNEFLFSSLLNQTSFLSLLMIECIFMKTRLVLVILISLCSVVSTFGNDKKGRVLILNSITFEENWSNFFIKNLNNQFLKKGNLPVDTFELRIPLLKEEQEVLELRERILAKYPEKPELVVFIGDPGWVACAPIFDNQWKDVPVMVCFSRERVPSSLPVLLRKEPLTSKNSIPIEEFNKNYNVTVLQQIFYVKETIKVMKQMMPNMNKLAFISDDRYISMIARKDVEKTLKEDYPDLILEHLCTNDITTSQLFDTLSTYDKNVGILFYSWFVPLDKDSVSYLESNAWKVMSGFTRNPIFTLADMDLARGHYAGGYYVSTDDFVENFINIFDSIRAGTPASAIPYQIVGKPRTYLSYVSLQWYRIDSSLYPKDAVYFDAPPTFYEENKYIIWLCALFVILLFCLKNYFNRKSNRHKQLNKRIINSIQDPVVLINKDGVFGKLLNNPLNPENVLPSLNMENTSMKDYVTDEQEYKEHMRLIRKVLHTKSSEDIKVKIKNVKGEDTYLYLRLVYFGSDRVISFIQNITEAEKERMKDDRYRFFLESTLNNLPIPTTVKDLNNDRKYLIWNKSAEEFFGVSAEMMVGNNEVPELGCELAQVFRKADMETIRTGTSHAIYHAPFADKKLHTFMLNKAVLSYRDGQRWLVSSAIDITELEEARKQLEILKERAEESNLLKSAFLANMSHEIRTPLNAIVGFSAIMAQMCDTPDAQEYAHIIETNNDLLLQLINDILDLSKIESGKLEFVESDMDVNVALNEIIETTRFRLKTDAVTLSFDESVPQCHIFADKQRVAQVLINFLTNAMKFTHQGSIRMGYRLVENDTKLYFYVKDTGMGIEPEKQKEIFRRFVKLNSFVQGTGLGLSICEMIIQKMDGDIGVNSTPDVGSEFWFTIPYRPVCKD